MENNATWRVLAQLMISVLFVLTISAKRIGLPSWFSVVAPLVVLVLGVWVLFQYCRTR